MHAVVSTAGNLETGAMLIKLVGLFDNLDEAHMAMVEDMQEALDEMMIPLSSFADDDVDFYSIGEDSAYLLDDDMGYHEVYNVWKIFDSANTDDKTYVF